LSAIVIPVSDVCNKRKHWITVTTKWCQRNKVSVYDTLFEKLDCETKGVI